MNRECSGSVSGIRLECFLFAILHGSSCIASVSSGQWARRRFRGRMKVCQRLTLALSIPHSSKPMLSLNLALERLVTSSRSVTFLLSLLRFKPLFSLALLGQASHRIQKISWNRDYGYSWFSSCWWVWCRASTFLALSAQSVLGHKGAAEVSFPAYGPLVATLEISSESNQLAYSFVFKMTSGRTWCSTSPSYICWLQSWSSVYLSEIQRGSA